MSIYYAGIGSRSTPEEVLEAFEYLGEELAIRGYILRSGGANGADSAFEKGCVKANGEKEIYLPWKGFNNNNSQLYEYQNNVEAMDIAKKYHPNFYALKPAAKSLMARNSYQVLGSDLQTPSSFVVCYTEGGQRGGGTGQALRIASDNNIMICDFGRWDTFKAIDIAKRLVLKVEELFPIQKNMDIDR